MALKSLLLVGAVVASLVPTAQPRAQELVYDPAAVAQLIQEVQSVLQLVQLAQQEVTQLIATVNALTDLPQDLEAQAAALLNQSLQSPLSGIENDLNNLLNGVGGASCGGGLGDANMLYQATAQALAGGGASSSGIDFLGAQINGNATRMSGVLACNTQMLAAVTQRLQNMQPLLDRLQACADVTCSSAVTGRMQWEAANTSAQALHAQMMASQAEQMRWIQQDQREQKARNDAEALVQSYAAVAGAGASPIAVAGQ